MPGINWFKYCWCAPLVDLKLVLVNLHVCVRVDIEGVTYLGGGGIGCP